MNALARLLLAGLLGLLPPVVQAAQPLAFCYNKDGSYPWTDPGRPGLSLRLATLVGQRLGVAVGLTGLPWQRCLTEVKAGHYQGALAASYKAERREFGRYPEDAHGRPDASKRLFNEQFVLVRPKGSKVAWDGKTVQPADARIATATQVSIVGTLRALGITVDDGTKGSEATLRKVALGRADAAVLLLNGAQFELHHHADLADRLEIAAPPVEDKVYYLLLGHAVEAAYARRIWDACEAVRDSPEYAAQQKAFFNGL